MDNLQYNGSIHLIIGPMMSYKSSELIRRYRRYKIAGNECIMVKHKTDTRYTEQDMIVTHDNISIESISCNSLKEIDNIIKNYAVICVDEIQFYKDADFYCEKWANEGKIVEACGLSGNYKREPFEVVSKLISLCETLTMLNSVCTETKNNAPFTKLLIENNTGSDILIGGAESYSPVDRQTYFKK